MPLPPTSQPSATAARGRHPLESALHGASRVSRWLAWVGGAMMLACAVLVSLDVVVRALFKATVFESFELSTYAFAIATALGMSYALASRAHIRIEVLYMMLRPARRGWLDVFAYALLAVCAGVLLYWCSQVVIGNYQSGARSNSSLALPLALPQGIWLLGLAWFCLVAVLYALYGLVQCLGRRPEAAHQRLGVASLEEEIAASGSRLAPP